MLQKLRFKTIRAKILSGFFYYRIFLLHVLTPIAILQTNESLLRVKTLCIKNYSY